MPTLASPQVQRYSPERARFSELAHVAAQTTFYPLFFPSSSLTFENTNIDTGARGRILDGQMGVDRIIRVKVPSLRSPLVFPVQERFRLPRYERFQDVTITEWNEASGQPSELFKISAGYFIYGYFDTNLGRFGEVVAVDVPEFLRQLVSGGLGNLDARRNRNEKRQTFLTFSFDELEACGALIFRLSRA